MKWTSVLAIFALFYVMSFFITLPLGVVTSDEAGGDKVPGQADSAPHNFRFGFHALRAAIVAVLLTGLYYLNYINGWITVADLDFLA